MPRLSPPKYTQPMKSHLYTPQVLGIDNSFHALGYSEQALDRLVELYQQSSSNEGLQSELPHLEKEILKRLNGFELASIIKQYKKSDGTKAKFICLKAFILKLNKMNDDQIFDCRAKHWLEFSAETKQESNKRYNEPHDLFFALQQRLELIRNNTRVGDFTYMNIYDLVGKNTISNMKSNLENIVIVVDTERNLIESSESLVDIQRSSSNGSLNESTAFIQGMAKPPEIVRPWAVTQAACSIADYTITPIANALSYIYQWTIEPVYLAFMSAVDRVREQAEKAIDFSLKPSVNLWLAALGSGTQLIGILRFVCTDAKWSPGVGLGLGLTGVVIAAIVNTLAATAGARSVLPRISLNQFFIFSIFGAASSALLAQPAPQTAFQYFADGGAVPPEQQATLPATEVTTAMVLGIILAVANGLTSTRSCYRSGWHMWQNVLGEVKKEVLKLSKIGLAYLTMMVISLSLLIMYSESISDDVSETKHKTWKYITMMVGVGVTNLITNYPVFFNQSFNLINSLMKPAPNEKKWNYKEWTVKEWSATLLTISLFIPFYIGTGFGNGKNSAEKIWDNKGFFNGIGVACAASLLPAALQAGRTMAQKATIPALDWLGNVICCCRKTATAIVARGVYEDEDEPLLEKS